MKDLPEIEKGSLDKLIQHIDDAQDKQVRCNYIKICVSALKSYRKEGYDVHGYILKLKEYIQ